MASSLSQPSNALRDAKRDMRIRVLAARDAMPATLRAAGADLITAAILARSDLAVARTVLATLPFGSEWDTRPLVKALLERDKVVAVPRVNRSTRMIDLFIVADLARDIAPGYQGIPEPTSGCVSIAPSAIDWILVPGVAFDMTGHRLGYGGGYYDRILPHASRAKRVAGAFELQIVERVPAAAHDLTVDAVLTEERTIPAARCRALPK